MEKKSITIIVPAYDEERNISFAIDNVGKAVEGLVDDYEIIVFDDGSHDQTGVIADEKTSKNNHIKVIHHQENKGFGYSYRQGLKIALMNYVGVFPGDNDMAWESLRDLIQNIGEADVITSYMEDTRKRSMFRRVLSRIYHVIMCTLFGLKLKYLNGSFICKKSRLDSISIKSNGLFVIAECLIRLIKDGSSYKEVCFAHIGRRNEKSKALSLKSIRAVVLDVFSLWKDIYIKKKKVSVKINYG